MVWRWIRSLKNQKGIFITIRRPHEEKEKKEEVLVLELPLPDNIANDRKNHWKHYKAKMAYYEEAAYLIQNWKVKHKVQFIYALRYKAHLEVAKLMDFDNMVARLKWPIDCMVHSDKKPWGFLQDDHPRHCWPKELPTQELKSKRGTARKIIFTLYPQDHELTV